MKRLFCLLILVGFFFNSGYSQVPTVNENATVGSSFDVTPNKEKAESLKKYFEPIQLFPEYYSDRKLRLKIPDHKVNEYSSYKANFGKKIWIKAWEYADVLGKISDFGTEIQRKKYRLSAIEVAEDVAPFVKKTLKGSRIDIVSWAERLEEFGRTYVNPDNAGKIKCDIEIVDYQNGNWIMIKATKPFKKEMIWFVSEDNDDIIKAALKYVPRDSVGNQKKIE